jgi:hypothetical protein
MDCEDKFSFYYLSSITEDEMIASYINDEEGAGTFNYLYNTAFMEERAVSIYECIKELRSEFKRDCPKFIEMCEMYQRFWTTYRFAKNMDDLIEEAIECL